MLFWRSSPLFILVACASVLFAQDSSSTAHKREHKPAVSAASLDPGTVTANGYRNKTLGLSYKIPQGWVLRTEEMDQRDETPQTASGSATMAPSEGAKVLLAAFSRPPAARGEDVNSSVLIAAESQAAYPGLKEAVQYFGPLS